MKNQGTKIMTPNQQPARSLLILSTRAFPFYIPLPSKPAPPTSAPGLGSKLWSTSTAQRQQAPALCASPTFNPGLPAPPDMGGTTWDLKNRHNPLQRPRTRGTTELYSGSMPLTTSHFSQNLVLKGWIPGGTSLDKDRLKAPG